MKRIILLAALLNVLGCTVPTELTLKQVCSMRTRYFYNASGELDSIVVVADTLACPKR
mgnify:CR=1 FL=1